MLLHTCQRSYSCPLAVPDYFPNEQCNTCCRPLLILSKKQLNHIIEILCSLCSIKRGGITIHVAVDKHKTNTNFVYKQGLHQLTSCCNLMTALYAWLLFKICLITCAAVWFRTTNLKLTLLDEQYTPILKNSLAVKNWPPCKIKKVVRLR